MARESSYLDHNMRVMVAVFALVFAANVAHAQDPRAERLVDGWIRAAGGPGVWDGVRDLRYTITTVWYDTSGVELRRRPRQVWIRKLPGAFQVRVERDEREGHYVQVWDGRNAWATLNGKLLADTTRATREVQYVAGDLTYWIGLPWKLRDPGVKRVYVDPSTVHVNFETGVGLHDGDRFWYYWRDPDSAFPTEVHYIEQGKSEIDRQRVLWSDWKRIGPVVHVGKRLTVDERGRPVRALLISDVVANGGIKAELFSN